MRQIESIFWGIIAAAGALFMQLVVFLTISTYQEQNQDFSFENFLIMPSFIVIAAAIEEIFKYIIILKCVDLYSLEKSYLVNSWLVGLGFFLVEFAMINQNYPTASNERLLEIAILHIGTAGLIGFTIATRNPKKIWTAIVAIFTATIPHLVYNLLQLKRESLFVDYTVFVLLGLLIMFNFINFFRIRGELARN